MVVLLPRSGGLRTNGREVSPSGLKPNSLTPRSCHQRSGIHGTHRNHGSRA